MSNYDVIIIGAGPGGIFAAYELAEKAPELKVAVFEAGNPLEKRKCPIDGKKIKSCVNCKTCAIMSGFGGAGAFSDGKYNITNDFGGTLYEHIGKKDALDLMRYVDEINVAYGGQDTKMYSTAGTKFKKLCMQNKLKLLDASVRHLGTDINYVVLENLYSKLKEHVDFYFNTPVERLEVLDDGYRIVTKNDATDCSKCIVSVGRSGSKWMETVCKDLNIPTKSNRVDIGVRVEVRDEVMEFLNKNLYEAKLVYYTPTFDDKVRTFCTNPSGEVATEYYENGLAVVNGHAYKSQEFKTNNTNFALLVSKNFTKPFKTPIEYGKQIAQLSNMLCDGKILVQTYGDFKRGRRTTEERLCRNNLIPTLKDAVPGDLSLVFPHRIMVDIAEMIEALDKVTPGIASDETLLYGVEVKFYSNKVVVDKDFCTSVKGLRAIGDGASVTRGLQQASANGLSVARSILKSMK